MRKQRYGDPLGGIVTPEDRFWAKVDKGDGSGCWLWTATIDTCGYGRVSWRGKLEGAHRVSLFIHGTSALAGVDVDHLCRVRHCVRPDHLEPVSHRENLRRGIGFGGLNVLKTHCPAGHPYDEVNTRVTREGGRVCRACATTAGRAAARARQLALPPDEQHHNTRKRLARQGQIGATSISP